jgi:hypothetical protein
MISSSSLKYPETRLNGPGSTMLGAGGCKIISSPEEAVVVFVVEAARASVEGAVQRTLTHPL